MTKEEKKTASHVARAKQRKTYTTKDLDADFGEEISACAKAMGQYLIDRDENYEPRFTNNERILGHREEHFDDCSLAVKIAILMDAAYEIGRYDGTKEIHQGKKAVSSLTKLLREEDFNPKNRLTLAVKERQKSPFDCRS
jgi:hypothetical protein